MNHRWTFNGTHWKALYYSDNPEACGNTTGNGYPGARHTATAWTEKGSGDALMLFGGFGFDVATNGQCSSGFLNDLNINFVRFPTAASTGAAKIGIYGTRGMFDVQNWPGGRSESVVWSDAFDDHYIYSGYGYGSTSSAGCLGDLWKWSALSGGFTWVAGPQLVNRPAQRGLYGEASLDYYPSGRYGSQIWKVAPNEIVWIFGEKSAPLPLLLTPRYPWVVPSEYGNRNRAGGQTLVGYANDLWVFDMRWALPGRSEQLGFAAMSVPATGAPVVPPFGTAQAASYPGGRSGAAFWPSMDGSRFFLFGGYGVAPEGTNTMLGDLWSLSCNVGEQQLPNDETTCNACTVTGTFNDVLGGNCTYCAVGSVPSSVSRTACRICLDGTVSVHSDVCTPCDAGTRSSADHGSCIACAAGYVSMTAAWMCSACGAGQTSTSGNTACVVCDAGYYSPTSGSLCYPCAAGMESRADRTACVACASGHFSSASGTSCLACGAGTTPTSNHTDCISCGPVAFSSTPGGTCTHCPLGTVSNANQTSCLACQVGSIRNSSSMTSCAPCGAGMFSDANRTRCARGKSWAWIGGSSGGNSTGNYSFPGAFNTAASPAGRYFSAFAQDKNGVVWMFGGALVLGTGSRYLADVWSWNEIRWKLVSGSTAENGRPLLNTDDQHPGATAHAMAWPNIGDGFQMFGGHTYTSASSGATRCFV